MKTTDRTLIEIIEQHGISPPSDEEHKEFNKLVVGKVTKVDLSAFVMIVKCPKCNSDVECDDSDFIECSCGVMALKENCIRISKVPLEISGIDGKIEVLARHEQM